MKSDVVGEVIQYLVLHRHCGGCGAPYDLENIHVLGQPMPWVWDLAAVCHQCHTLTMVSAVVEHESDTHGRAPGSHSEVTRAEQAYFAELPPISTDDVLDLVEFLADFDGDFRGLFSRGADEE